MHIAADGTLTVHPIGINRICRNWVADPNGDEHASWLRPAAPLEVHPIEEPITIAGPDAARP
jgi:hypothetical protein